MTDTTAVDRAQAEALKDLLLVYFPAVCLLIAAFCWLAPKALDAWDRWKAESPHRQARRALKPPMSHCRVVPKSKPPYDIEKDIA